MPEIALEGGYSRRSDVIEDDYHIFRLNQRALQQLASFLEGMASTSQSLKLDIGDGRLWIETVSEGFLASLTSSGAVLLQLGRRELTNLVNRITRMANCEADPGDVIQIHLDYSFTAADQNISDVVIERIDA